MQVEFKLFGSLTIKQFLSLAGGIIIAVFLYFLPLPIVLGWPLILISLVIGFALTFVTVNGQPFSRWFGNFLVAIFSSQKYVWRKTTSTPKSLQTGTSRTTVTKSEAKTKKELGITPIAEVVKQQSIKLDSNEEKDLARLDKYFEAEYSKYSSKALQDAGKAKQVISEEPSKRVNMGQQNLAGSVNPIGRKQSQVKVGKNDKVVYTNMVNRSQRPLSMDQEDLEIEEKVREIIQKQRILDPYMKTSEIEAKEKKLKEEMRKLYQQIQSLKEK